MNMEQPKPLSGKVCVVTGATRGVGKGIALQLGAAGATVYITGRTLKRKEDDPVGGSLEETAEEVIARGGKCVQVQCDHTKDEDIKALFERVAREQHGQLDLLVNNAYSAVHAMASIMGKKFWEVDPEFWDVVNNVGVRNHYFCSVLASRLMVARKQGLIINISSAGGLAYIFSVAYGVGKEACDRMAADCALELKKENVAFVSLWPGFVRTENVIHLMEQEKDDPFARMGDLAENAAKLFENGESPEYAGMAVAKLAADPNIMKKTGRVLIAADLGNEYGFTDIDGERKYSMRELGYTLSYITKKPIFFSLIPSFIKIPCWILSLYGNKF